MLPITIHLPLGAVCTSRPLENPATGQDPQLQIVPLVPGQRNQRPLFQSLLVTYGPVQKPQDRLNTGLPIPLLPSVSGRTPECLTADHASKSWPQPPCHTAGAPSGEAPPASSNASGSGTLDSTPPMLSKSSREVRLAPQKKGCGPLNYT